MATFGLHDTYKITNSKRNEKFSIDYKVLIRLYEPIIGSIASSLYLTLESELSLNKYQKEPFTISRLTKLTQLTNESFNKAIDTLVDYDLISIQSNTKKKDDYLFKIKKTKSAEEFFENKKLLNALEVTVDEMYFSQIKEYFISSQIDENDYIDIQEVKLFKEMTSNEFYDSFALKYPVISNSLVLDEKAKKEIDRVKNLFNLTYNDVEAVLLQSIDYNSNEEMVVNLNKFNDIVASSNKKEKEAIKTLDFDDERAISYYQKLAGRTNLLPREIDMFEKLLNEFNISEGILNVITNYCFKYKKMQGQIPYNYYKKVIEAMIINNVKTTNDAMEYFRNLVKKPTANQEEKVITLPKEEIKQEVKEEKKSNSDVYKRLRDLIG